MEELLYRALEAKAQQDLMNSILFAIIKKSCDGELTIKMEELDSLDIGGVEIQMDHENKSVTIKTVDHEIMKAMHEKASKSMQVTKEEAHVHNMNKLLKGKNARYAAGSYSDKAAQDRADKGGVQ